MIPRRCLNCGNGFMATYKTRRYCDTCNRENKHERRTERRKEHKLEFIGVDGEGVNRPDGNHDYILLSVGNRSLHHNDGRRLTFFDIIPFLWECFLANPEATYVGFYLGYDFTNWLRDLPEERARMLLTDEGINKRKRTRSGNNHIPFPVRYREWNFDVLPMKRLRLWHEDSNQRMYICDTGAYFQTSFLNAIAPENWPDGAIVTEAEYKKIAAGKSERGQDVVPYGTPVDDEMIEYNILENDVLGRLMAKYNEGLVNIGVRLKKDQWFGPGQAAQSWLTSINAPTRIQFEESVPDITIRTALRSSYYGGWFEIFAHGHIPGYSYGYDLNSAYPHFQSQLPCALHGKWTQGINDGRSFSQLSTLAGWTLVHASITGSNDRIGGVPHRLKTGHILRPQITQGWYWTFELEASQRAGLIDDINVLAWVNYSPCRCPNPFLELRNLYIDRLRVGKKTIAGKSRRLVYNSTYGKTAQSIGAAKYANPFYASAITAKCRTAILDTIATHPNGVNDVLMVATDGLVFHTRHQSLNLSDTVLGDWSETQHENLTLFMPGVYWDDSTRDKVSLGEAPSLKSRGISARALAKQISHIDSLFANPFEGEGYPSLDIPLSFSIISPKQALAWNKWNLCGTVYHDKLENEEDRPIRHISSDPVMKRIPIAFLENGIIRTSCYRTAFGETESTPYKKTFGDEHQRELAEIITPDGTIEMLLPGMLR